VAQIQTGVGEANAAYCLIRKHEYVLTPEERVRQALLWFLTAGASSAANWMEQLRIEVEYCSLDVVAYYAGITDNRFRPNVATVVFETKRLEVSVGEDDSTENQIRRYMVRERCRFGLMFTCRQAIWVELIGNFTAPEWRRCQINDLSEVECRINRATHEMSEHASKWVAFFRYAAEGDFDSFRALVALFGQDLGLTFVLSIRSNGQIGSLRAFRVRVRDSDLVDFYVRSAAGKRPVSLKREDFHSLRSVEPL
jgi:hypothetical protein